MSYHKTASFLIVALSLSPPIFSAENSEKKGASESNERSTPEGALEERFDRFVRLNEKLKTAVCDESFVSKAPSLESLATDGSKPNLFKLQLGASVREHEIISFLLGDAVSGVYSEHTSQELRGLLEKARSLPSNSLAATQSAVVSVKRRTAIEICEGLVHPQKLEALLATKPSRFFSAASSDRAPAAYTTGDGTVLEVFDRQNRFGKTDRGYLVAGWIEPYEIERVFISAAGKQRTYRRVAHPVTNSTQGLELVSTQGVPVGMFYVSREQAESDWTLVKAWSELPESRTKQIASYEQRIESEALEAYQKPNAKRQRIRDLQEFYKKLLQAYQLFPDEKQFDAYAKTTTKKTSLEDVIKNTLGQDFLSTLKTTSVNGSPVHLGLFKPDPKLHAIYSEYSQRLRKLASE